VEAGGKELVSPVDQQRNYGGGDESLGVSLDGVLVSSLEGWGSERGKDLLNNANPPRRNRGRRGVIFGGARGRKPGALTILGTYAVGNIEEGFREIAGPRQTIKCDIPHRNDRVLALANLLQKSIGGGNCKVFAELW